MTDTRKQWTDTIKSSEAFLDTLDKDVAAFIVIITKHGPIIQNKDTTNGHINSALIGQVYVGASILIERARPRQYILIDGDVKNIEDDN